MAVAPSRRRPGTVGTVPRTVTGVRGVGEAAPGGVALVVVGVVAVGTAVGVVRAAGVFTGGRLKAVVGGDVVSGLPIAGTVPTTAEAATGLLGTCDAP